MPFFPCYIVAKPSQYIVKTGLGIKDMIISKKAIVWPFQKFIKIDLTPRNYEFKLETMSSEKLQCIIPCSWTIGPNDTQEEILKYVKFIQTIPDLTSFMKGIIEGETRIITAGQSIEEIFKNRDIFKQDVINGVQEDLKKFGLTIYNANIKELEDHPGSEYFILVRQKVLAEAKNSAIVNVAEQDLKGQVFSAETSRNLRVRKAELETEALLFENRQNIEQKQSTMEAVVKATNFERQQEIANIEREQAIKIRNMELQRDLETIRIAQQKELLRADILNKAQIESEALERQAEARLFQITKESEAKKKQAEAEQYTLECKAKGLLATLEAQSQGLQQLINSTQDSELLVKFLLIDSGLMEKLAQTNAEAIKGLQPKISYWNTGGNTDNPLTDIFKNIPPIVDTVYRQAGLSPPSFLATTEN